MVSVLAEVDDGEKIPLSNNISIFEETQFPNFPKNLTPSPVALSPIVCGFGPAGMFCALLLARMGFRPIVLERGDDIDTRTKKANIFLENCTLDPDSNIQFGEGGAGAFSDGKLITRINDPLTSFVLETLREHGAPNEITTLARAHIGTDLLCKVVKNIRLEIEELGGKVLFRHKLVNVEEKGNLCVVTLENGEKLSCPALFLATGHSSHDTYRMLYKNNFPLIAKDFSVGVRIEHFQRDVERSLYGRVREENDILPKAEYNVSLREGERGVYSFCMCPGGLVMATASEDGTIVTNGMSYHARNKENSNCALAVSVLKSDFSNHPMRAIEFQRELERKAFLNTSDYRAPAQTVGDFLEGRKTLSFNGPSPSYPHSVAGCNLDTILPSFVSDMLKKGLRHFGSQYSFFKDVSAPLTAVETRTSSPIRIEREKNFRVKGFNSIFPCGEGAGWAGGITSAAVDGLRCAEEYIKGNLV